MTQFFSLLRLWSRNVASHLQKLPSYLDSPHFLPSHTSKKPRKEQVDQRRAPSKLWRIQAKTHNLQTTSNIKNRKKNNRSGSIVACSTPHDYKPSSVLALSASPNLRSHLRSHPFIRSSLHQATRWALFTQQRNPDTGSGHSVSTHWWSTLKTCRAPLYTLKCAHMCLVMHPSLYWKKHAFGIYDTTHHGVINSMNMK